MPEPIAYRVSKQASHISHDKEEGLTIVISTGRPPVELVAQVDGVHVRAEDGERAVGLAVDVRDDAVLREAVVERADRDSVFAACQLKRMQG